MTKKNINLTSSEIASLWTTYMNSSMAKCILGFLLKHIKDEEIHVIIQQDFDVNVNLVETLKDIFLKENIEIPDGFGDNDMNPNAPSLYTDSFCLMYVNHMAKVGLLAFSAGLAMSAREDIRNLYTKGLIDTSSLYNNSAKVAIDKGIFIRTPSIVAPKGKDYVDSKSYLNGFNPFKKNRPINAVEISHLSMNIQTNHIGYKVAISFAQASPSEQVQQFMLRGKDISQKHIKVFRDILLEENISAPMASDIGITNSTIPPFSDKLMMFHMSLLSAAGIGNYAAAASASQRADLALNYERLSAEIGKYAKEGADIMIKNNWLEQPPGTIDKETLSKEKEPY